MSSRLKVLNAEVIRCTRCPRLRNYCREVARIKKRGISHPYVKNFVLARTTPLTRQRKTLPGFEQTFRKLVDNIEAFDVSKVRYEDIQRSAIMAVPAG